MASILINMYQNEIRPLDWCSRVCVCGLHVFVSTSDPQMFQRTTEKLQTKECELSCQGSLRVLVAQPRDLTGPPRFVRYSVLLLPLFLQGGVSSFAESANHWALFCPQRTILVTQVRSNTQRIHTHIHTHTERPAQTHQRVFVRYSGRRPAYLQRSSPRGACFKAARSVLFPPENSSRTTHASSSPAADIFPRVLVPLYLAAMGTTCSRTSVGEQDDAAVHQSTGADGERSRGARGCGGLFCHVCM